MIDPARLSEVRKWLAGKHTGKRFRPASYDRNLKALHGWRIPEVERRDRRLPHWRLDGVTYYVTISLVSRDLGQILAAGDGRPCDIFEELLFYEYRVRYDLDAYVVMPDHAHLLIKPLAGESLDAILGQLKGRTSREINEVVGRNGHLWKREAFDTIIRDGDHWLDKVHYIHQNPVRGGLVSRPEDYRWSSLATMHSEGRLESFPW